MLAHLGGCAAGFDLALAELKGCGEGLVGAVGGVIDGNDEVVGADLRVGHNVHEVLHGCPDDALGVEARGKVFEGAASKDTVEFGYQFSGVGAPGERLRVSFIGNEVVALRARQNLAHFSLVLGETMFIHFPSPVW